MSSTIGFIFILVGLWFDFFGCLGLVRFPDVYNRLQASTKCVTFGTCSILFGTFLIMGLGAAGMKCLLTIGFLALTSPTAAHVLARSTHKAGIPLWKQSECDMYTDGV